MESADYGRACAASVQWISRLPVGNGFGLLLGGDPASVLVAMGEDSVVSLVRWVFADDERELVDFALRGECVLRTEPDLIFENRLAHWRMFNAAADPFVHEAEIKELELPVGQLRVTTAYLEFDCNAAIVHRFERER